MAVQPRDQGMFHRSFFAFFYVCYEFFARIYKMDYSYRANPKWVVAALWQAEGNQESDIGVFLESLDQLWQN